MDSLIFQNQTAVRRTVVIPAGADAAKRDQFARKIRDAMRQQAMIASKSDAVLVVYDEKIEVRPDRIIIPHEPAAAIDVAKVINAAARPSIEDLWWFTWALLRGCKAAADANAFHGCLQLGAVYLDEAGRIKVGDFGLGMAFESVFGRDARQQIHLDTTDIAATGDGPHSGVWSLLEDYRDFGWLLPCVAPELLGDQGGGRLAPNPRTDQFSLGVLLSVLGTGSHPYNVELSERGVEAYFLYDPEVRTKRPDWKDALDRFAKKVGRADDKRIIDWCDLVERLSRFELGDRFQKLDEPAQVASGVAPAAWDEALQALSEAQSDLSRGKVDSAIRAAKRFKEEATLPAVWRTQLSTWAIDLDRRRADIEEQIRAEQRREGVLAKLIEAETLLQDAGQPDSLSRARAIADEVEQSPDADDTIRRRAARVREDVDKLSNQVNTFTVEMFNLARDYFTEHVRLRQYEAARQDVFGVQNDPNMMRIAGAWPAEALAQVAAAEQREREIESELATVRDTLEAGLLDSALQAAETLLSHDDLLDEVRQHTRELHSAAEQAIAQREEFRRRVASAQQLLESGDAESAASELSYVPSDCRYDGVADERAAIERGIASLRRALELERAGDAAVAADKLEDALSRFNEAQRSKPLPLSIGDRIKAKAESCSTRLRDLIKAAQTSLQSALQAYDRVDLVAARSALDNVQKHLHLLPPDEFEAAEFLSKLLMRTESARSSLDFVREHMVAGEARAALDILNGIDTDGLPRELTSEFEQLRNQAESLLREAEERERSLVSGQLDQVRASLADGNLKDGLALLDRIEKSGALGNHAELIAAAKSLREQAASLAPLLDSLADIEKQIKARRDVDEIRALRERLPATIPAWAQPRIDAIDAWIAKRDAEKAAALADAARKGLDDAAAALDAGRLSAAQAALEAVKSAAQKDSALAERFDALQRTLREFEQWDKHAAEVESHSAEQRWAEAYKLAVKLLKSQDAPAAFRERIQKQHDIARKQIATRQKEIDTALTALDSEATQAAAAPQKPAIIKALHARADTLRAEPSCSPDQRTRAEALIGRIDQIPTLKTKPPIGTIAAVVVVIAAIGGGYAFFKPGPDPGPGPKPDPTPGPKALVDATREARQAELNKALAEMLSPLGLSYEVRIDSNDGKTAQVAVADAQRIFDGRSVGEPVVGNDALDALPIKQYAEQALKYIESVKTQRDGVVAHAAKRYQSLTPSAGQKKLDLAFKFEATPPTAVIPGRIIATAANAEVDALRIDKLVDLRNDHIDGWLTAENAKLFGKAEIVTPPPPPPPPPPASIQASRISILVDAPGGPLAHYNGKLEPLALTAAVPVKDWQVSGLAIGWKDAAEKQREPRDSMTIAGTLAEFSADATDPVELRITASEPTGGFPAFLTKLQQRRASALVQSIAAELPPEVAQALDQPQFQFAADGGVTITQKLKPSAGENPLAVTINAAWKLDTLDYQPNEAVTALRTKLAVAYLKDRGAATLASPAWNADFWRPALAALDGAPGLDFFADFSLVALSSAAPLGNDGKAFTISAVLAPPGASAESADRMTDVPLRVSASPQGFAFAPLDAAAQTGLRKALQDNYDRLSTLAEFNARRLQEAAKAKDPALTLTADELAAAARGEPVKRGNESITFARAGGDLRYTHSVSTVDAGGGNNSSQGNNNSQQQPAGSSTAELLRSLVGSTDQAKIAEALRAVARDKADRFKFARRTGRPFEPVTFNSIGDLTQRLRASQPFVSAAPDRFVEYYDAPDGLYGITWGVNGPARVFRTDKPGGGALLSEVLGGTAANLAFAPDGALWNEPSRWQDVNFGGGTLRGNAALWCLPSLALQARPALLLGQAVRGFADREASFVTIADVCCAGIDDQRANVRPIWSSRELSTYIRGLPGFQQFWKEGDPNRPTRGRLLITIISE